MSQTTENLELASPWTKIWIWVWLYNRRASHYTVMCHL